jgi:hypothetical protein
MPPTALRNSSCDKNSSRAREQRDDRARQIVRDAADENRVSRVQPVERLMHEAHVLERRQVCGRRYSGHSGIAGDRIPDDA